MKNPKAAGTSIFRQILLKEFNEKLIQANRDPERLNKWFSEITDEQLEEYYIFTIIRNPFSRFVSISKYFGLSFKKFVGNYDEYFQKNIDIKIHALPQHLFTHFNGEQFVDKICRIECLH